MGGGASTGALGICIPAECHESFSRASGTQFKFLNTKKMKARVQIARRLVHGVKNEVVGNVCSAFGG